MEYKIDKHFSELINISKIITIILVCYVHSYRDTINFAGSTLQLNIPIWFETLQFSLSKVVAASAVPVFFFFSAFLLYKKDFSYKENLKKKIKTLFIPYIIFNTLGILTYFILQQIPALSIFFSKPEFIISNWHASDWLNAFIGYRNGFPLLFPLWFLRNLIVLNIFCILIKKLIEKFKLKFILIIGFLYCFLGYFVSNIHLSQGILSLFYWSLGGYFVINKMNLDVIINFVKKYHLFFVYFIGMLTYFVLQYKHIHNIQLLNVILVLTGSVCIISFAYILNNSGIKNFILSLSPYVFPIYLMHEFSLQFFRKLLSAILPNSIVFVATEYIFCPIIIIIYCIVIAFLIKKFSPKIYSVMFGQRL